MPPRKTKDSAAPAKKERATRAKKDPNAPKKPSGAYIFFCNDKRAEVKKANPEYGVAESGRELGAMWKAASDADKQKYFTQAQKDKERYTKEAAAYSSKIEAKDKDKEEVKNDDEESD